MKNYFLWCKYMAGIIIQSRKTQGEVSDLSNRLSTLETEINQNLGNRVNGLLNEGYIQQTLDTFLASDEEVRNGLAQLIQSRTDLHESVKEKFNGLIDVLVAGLDFHGYNTESLKLGDILQGGGNDGGDAGAGGDAGEGGEVTAPVHGDPTLINITEMYKMHSIQYPFKRDRESGILVDLNNMVDGENNLWDFSQISVVQEDAAFRAFPAGFAINNDGQILNWGEAFLNLNDSVLVAVTHVNGTLGMLSLQDIS